MKGKNKGRKEGMKRKKNRKRKRKNIQIEEIFFKYLHFKNNLITISIHIFICQ